MWGPGALVHIINILPFAGPVLYTLLYQKRYNWLQHSPIGNKRNYNRRWWVRVFFGRFNYFVLIMFGSFYTLRYYQERKASEEQIRLMTAHLYEHHKYDEEETITAHRVLVYDMVKRSYSKTRDNVLKERALRNHELKTAAFKEYADLYEKI